MIDADRFEAFVREYQDLVFGTAVRLIGNSAEAEDVAQTVFLKAFERFDEVSQSPTVPGWLKTVTTNLCLNHLSRYRSRWRLFSEIGPADSGEWSLEQRVPADDSPSRALEAAERDASLEDALARLPRHQRIPLVLFHFEHRSYQEIADRLGVSLGKVKTDMHRGRSALRHALGRGDGPE